MDSEAAIRDVLAEDPWADDILKIASVKPWSVWLRANAATDHERRSRDHLLGRF
jgi:hypothetical protein